MNTPVYLVMVESNNNHNKYYRMTDLGNGTWKAEWGRVGAGSQSKVYPIAQWDKKYREKVGKGYVDRSHFYTEPVAQPKKHQSSDGYKPITDASVRGLIDYLMEKARTTVRTQYKVSSEQVTIAMINAAQYAIKELTYTNDIYSFNQKLMELFTIIPRRMGRVSDGLAKVPGDIPRIVKREQDLLDVMRGQVTQTITLSTSASSQPVADMTILDALGLKIRDVSPNERSIIEKQLGTNARRYVKAWRVINKNTQKRYNDFLKKSGIKRTKLFWHGSRTENWWNILQTGLMLNPTNAVITGKMFGYGIYYAPSAQKSLGYTSLSGSYWAGGSSRYGFMALMDVAYGDPMDVYSFSPRYTSFTAKNLGKYDCLHAHSSAGMLRNDEVVIYREEQNTIKFLVELQ